MKTTGGVSVFIIAAMAVAACSGGDDAGDTTTTVPPDDTRTDATTTTTAPPATVATTAVPTTPTTTPLPDLVTRRQLVVTGPEEVVFDWTTDRCEDEHIPDIAARAYRTADGQVNLTIGHYVTYRMRGPSLDEVVTDCSTVQLASDFDPDPSRFDDAEWLGSPYTFDGETIYAVAHSEYRGWTHGAARPGQCPSGEVFPCLDTSFTMQISTDGGDTFTDIAPPPNHMIATLPYEYLDETVPSGIRQPSDIIEGPDGYFYLFGNVSDRPDEEQWVCAMRTDDLADPSSWRFWDGTDFTGEWKNPYLEPVDPDIDKCAPLDFGALSGSVQESIVFDELLDAYVMVGYGDSPGAPGTQLGFYYATSTDLIDWTARQLLLDVPANATVVDPDTDLTHAYPSLIDPDSPSLNFSTSDGELYLYLSRFNFGGGSLDRDLLRWPIAVTETIVDPPDWTFDDAADIDPDRGGWQPFFDVAPLELADGRLVVTATGSDPHIVAAGLGVPAEYRVLRLRMRTPATSRFAAQLFFITDEDPDYDESKSIVVPLDPSGELVDYELDMSTVPGWEGTITAIRIDPIDGLDAPIEIDRIWFPTSG